MLAGKFYNRSVVRNKNPVFSESDFIRYFSGFFQKIMVSVNRYKIVRFYFSYHIFYIFPVGVARSMHICNI